MKDFLHIEKVFLSCQTKEHKATFVLWVKDLIRKGIVHQFDVENYDYRLRRYDGQLD